jgi:hypothetical protein
LVGVVLPWTSPRWTAREKLVGTLVLPGGLAPAFFLMAGYGLYSCGSTSVTGPDGVTHQSREVCSGQALPDWAAWLIIAVLVFAPLIAGIWLGVRASRTADVGELRPGSVRSGDLAEEGD